MARRLFTRESNGRFRQASLERDFGLRTAVCPKCGAFNPYGRKMEDGPFPMPGEWEKPETCGQCGEKLE